MNNFRLAASALLTLAGAFLGCGPTDGKFMLEGTVTWNGAPIERGDIELQPADGKGQPDGAPIVNGKFTVRTNAGSKKISVFAQKQIGLTEATERIPTPEPIMVHYIPEKFNDRTELERTVEAGEALKLDLVGEERPHGAASPAEAARAAAQGGTGKD